MDIFQNLNFWILKNVCFHVNFVRDNETNNIDDKPTIIYCRNASYIRDYFSQWWNSKQIVRNIALVF